MRTQVQSPLLLQNLVSGLPEPTPISTNTSSQAFAFRPYGLLAVTADSIGQTFPAKQAPAPIAGGAVAVVEIGWGGPLFHHATPLADSYDAMKVRVGSALASPAACVLMSIDTNGGLVAGCIDTAQELRAMALAAGKPLYCYIDSMACSAGYAIACAASRIFIPFNGFGWFDRPYRATGGLHGIGCPDGAEVSRDYFRRSKSRQQSPRREN